MLYFRFFSYHSIYQVKSDMRDSPFKSSVTEPNYLPTSHLHSELLCVHVVTDMRSSFMLLHNGITCCVRFITPVSVCALSYQNTSILLLQGRSERSLNHLIICAGRSGFLFIPELCEIVGAPQFTYQQSLST